MFSVVYEHVGGVVVRALDSQSKGRGYDPWFYFQVMTLGKLFTCVPLSINGIIWCRLKIGDLLHRKGNLGHGRK